MMPIEEYVKISSDPTCLFGYQIPHIQIVMNEGIAICFVWLTVPVKM